MLAVEHYHSLLQMLTYCICLKNIGDLLLYFTSF